MFTDTDWDNSAPAPLAPASRAHQAAVLLLTAAAGLVLGALVASWWWTVRTTPPAVPAASAQAPQTPEPSAIVATAAPAAGPIAAPASEAAAAPAPVSAPRRAVTTEAAPDPGEHRHRMEQAWQRHYVRPPECAQDRRGERLVECANHYIRARREFEANYPSR